MSNTANHSLGQVKKTEEDAAKMIAHAQKIRDEKIAQKQAALQKDFLTFESEIKENAQKEISLYRDELTEEGRKILHDAKKEAEKLKGNLIVKKGQAIEKAFHLIKQSLKIS